MILRIVLVLILFQAPWAFASAAAVKMGSSDGINGVAGAEQQKRYLLLNPCDPDSVTCVSFSNPISFAADTELTAAYRLFQPAQVVSLQLVLTDASGLDIISLINQSFSPPSPFPVGLNTIDFVSQACSQCILKLTLELKNGKKQSYGASVQFNASGTLIGNGANSKTAQQSAEMGSHNELNAAGEPSACGGFIDGSSSPNTFLIWILMAAILLSIRWLRRVK